jgi:hypothetical protein
MLYLNSNLDKCLEIIAIFNDFTIYHVSREENTVVNDFSIASIRFLIESRKSVCSGKTGYSGLLFWMFRFVAIAWC